LRRIQVGETDEPVIEPADFPPDRVAAVLGSELVGVLGYGTQGRAQSQNMRDGGVPVIVGAREDGPSWDLARADGWIVGQSLFPLAEAAGRATIVAYLLSDSGQKAFWPRVRPHLTSGKALYLSHGFSLVFSQLTGVDPPPDIDVIQVAPKGSGTTLRRAYGSGRGMNASFTIHQDATGRARDRCLACAYAIGAKYLFETTLRNEVYADLTGERGVLLGAIYGLWLAQYEVLRSRGHSPQEAFNETVEEATQSLYPLIAENGMDWMYRNCSATARRGALDWFDRFRHAVKPVFEELYNRVADGSEARRVLESTSHAEDRDQLHRELDALSESEMWQVGRILRSLRAKEGDSMSRE
jgi:ketol-acid reductoisomerase